MCLTCMNTYNQYNANSVLPLSECGLLDTDVSGVLSESPAVLPVQRQKHSVVLWLFFLKALIVNSYSCRCAYLIKLDKGADCSLLTEPAQYLMKLRWHNYNMKRSSWLFKSTDVGLITLQRSHQSYKDHCLKGISSSLLLPLKDEASHHLLL